MFPDLTELGAAYHFEFWGKVQGRMISRVL
jgi:hypothetical protein